MAFTTSDSFERVLINTSDINPSQLDVYVKNTNGDEFRYHFGQGNIGRLKMGRRSIRIG